MIKDLDEAAAPTSTIKVLKLGQGVSSQQAQEVLSNVLGEGGSSSRKSQQGQNSNRQQPRNRQQSGENRNSKSSGNSSSK